MTGPIRTNSAGDPESPHSPQGKTGPKAPRPPNSWIIYRADKMRTLFGKGSDQPRLPQADVSKIISNMWKNESNEVRNEYDRRAELKKAEHYAKFPNYRFQPKTKEDKLRERDEARKEPSAKPKRGRTKTSPSSEESSSPKPQPAQPAQSAQPAQAIPPHLSSPERRFGTVGPSPPLSAASSPRASGSAPPTPLRLDESQLSDTSTLEVLSTGSPLTPATPGDYSELGNSQPLFFPEQIDSPYSAEQDFSQFLNSMGTDTFNQLSLSFGGQSFNVQPTGDPSAFSLDLGMPNNWDFLSLPEGPHEFGMGSFPETPISAGIDPIWNGFQMQSPTEYAEVSSSASPSELHAPIPQPAISSSIFAKESEYFDYEPEDPPVPPKAISPPRSEKSRRSSYAPPAGAAKANQRRAAGAWKKPPASVVSAK